MSNRSIARPTPADASTWIALGCSILFALPFFAGGVIMVGVAASIAASPTADRLGSYAFGVGGAVFMAVGAAIVFTSLGAYSEAKALAARKAAAPNEPWLWRDDWASNFVKSDSGKSALGLGLFAFFWNLFAIPVAYMVVSKWRAGEAEVGVLFVLLFPLIGIFVMWAAVGAVMRQVRFGRTRLRLNAIPIQLGSQSWAQLEVPPNLRDVPRIAVDLSCIKREVVGSGKNRSQRDIVLWEEHLELEHPQFTPGPDGDTIPITFGVPIEGEETRVVNDRLRYFWRADVKAAVAGPDYDASFELPVFGRSASPGSGRPMFGATTLQPTRPRNMESSLDLNVGTILRFGPGVNRGSGGCLLLFGAMVLAASIAVLLTEAPVLFAFAAAGVGLLLMFGGWHTRFSRSEAIVSGRTLTILRTNGLSVSERTYAAGEVASATPRIESQTNGRATYSVRVRGTDGREFILAAGLRDLREARWVVEELERLLGGINLSGQPHESASSPQ